MEDRCNLTDQSIAWSRTIIVCDCSPYLFLRPIPSIPVLEVTAHARSVTLMNHHSPLSSTHHTFSIGNNLTHSHRRLCRSCDLADHLDLQDREYAILMHVIDIRDAMVTREDIL